MLPSVRHHQYETPYDTAAGMRALSLHEQVVLLALRERKGTLTWHGCVLGGACLAALCLHGRLRIGPGRKALIEVVDQTPLGESVLDDCLEKVVRARRQARAAAWVMRFNKRKAYHQTASGLRQRDILRADDIRAWLFFTRRVYEIVDSEPRRRFIDGLRKAIFDDSASLDVDRRVDWTPISTLAR